MMLAALAGSAAAQLPRPALPWALGFEAPNYSPTFNGNGVLVAGTLTQDSWLAGGAYFVRADAPFAGSQYVQARGGLLVGGSFGGWRKFPRVLETSGGTMVIEVRAKVQDTATGRSVLSFELWGATAAATVDQENVRIMAIGLTDLGTIGIRDANNVAAQMAVQTVPNDTYADLMLVYHNPTKSASGFVNFAPLTNASNVPLNVPFTGTTAYASMGEIDFNNLFQSTIITRNAFGMTTSDPRGNELYFIDELRVNHFPDARTVRANLALLNFDGSGKPITNIGFTATFTPVGGGAPINVTGSLNASGQAVFQAPANGAFDIKVKPAGYLSRTFSNVTVSDAGVFNLAGSCKPGDVDANGEVDLTDIDLIIASYLNSGNNLVEDLDGNGEVDLTDIDIAIGNYLSGDE